jgi:hypothetical protein
VLVIPGLILPETWLEICDWWLAVEVSGRGSRIYDREFERPSYLAPFVSCDSHREKRLAASQPSIGVFTTVRVGCRTKSR